MTSNLEGLAAPPPAADGEKRALVIAAHPDDAEFGAAGTVYLWSRAGWEFYYLVCTNGAKGSVDESITSEELGPSRALLGDVVRCIRRLRPAAVFTHDPEAVIIRDSFVNHSDHRVTGLA